MFKFLRKRDKLKEQADIFCSDFETAWGKRLAAVDTLREKRRNTGFYKMTQGVYDDGYDLVDFETVKEKYVGYFLEKTFLNAEEITKLLKDIYDAGVENKMTNQRLDAFAKTKSVLM